MIEIYFFAFGALIITVLIYMLIKIRRTIKNYEKLFQINKISHFDLEKFCEMVDLPREIKGVYIDVEYEYYKFAKMIGKSVGKKITREFRYEDFDIKVVVYSKTRNEDYWLMQIYADFLSMNLFLDASIKINSIMKSFENLKAYQLHSLHELKNIIQMLKFLNYKYKLDEFGDLNEKLSKILLMYNKNENEEIESLEIKKTFKRLMKVYPVKYKRLRFRPAKRVPKVFNMILSNIMQNIYEENKECEMVFENRRLIVSNEVDKKVDIHKIFNPFFTNKKNGLGLGMFIVKKAVEEHGGAISAEIRDKRLIIDINFDNI